MSSFSIEPRTFIFPWGCVVVPRASDASAIFLRLSTSRTYFPRPSCSVFVSTRRIGMRTTMHSIPREITYDSQCTCLFLLVLALYNRSLFPRPSEITDSEQKLRHALLLDLCFSNCNKTFLDVIDYVLRSLCIFWARNNRRLFSVWSFLKVIWKWKDWCDSIGGFAWSVCCLRHRFCTWMDRQLFLLIDLKYKRRRNSICDNTNEIKFVFSDESTRLRNDSYFNNDGL